MDLEIIYVSPTRQIVIPLSVNSPCTVNEAIQQSNILNQFPEIDLQKQSVGIWNKTVSLDMVCSDGDRIEIYRPLIIDPKQARKKRA